MKKILVIGRHHLILERTLNIISNHGHQVKGILDTEEAIQWVLENHPDIVFLSGGIEPSTIKYIQHKLDQRYTGEIIPDSSPHTIHEKMEDLKG